MKATYINYQDTKSFSKLLIDYIEGNNALDDFYGNRPDLEGFKKQIASKSGFTHRDVLKQALLQQYEALPDAEESVANIQRLDHPETYTVTTGHQLNIFTGPLYFIFKIATTIKLTKQLAEAFPEQHFVPVYWMATEDHDFDEINHTFLGGKKIAWPLDTEDATGRLCTQSMDDAVKRYQGILGLSENSERLAQWIASAYVEHTDLASATRFLVHQLFKRYGLVILDADQPALKSLFIPHIKAELIDQQSHKLIQETSDRLNQAGYIVQVTPREINLFYLHDGYRKRIVQQPDGSYVILDKGIHFSQAALLKEVDAHPERFSPNVVLRPLYQEIILPNLAYIGGAAEMAYWMQLKPFFDYAAITFPILVPRNSALLANESLALKIYRLNLSFADMFKKTELLKQSYVRIHTKHRLSLSDERREFSSIFEKIKLRAHKIDPTLSPSADAVKARLERALNTLEKKLMRAEKHNFKNALASIDRIKNTFFPNGVLQERIENFGLYYVKYGDVFIDDLVKHFKPLNFKFTVLY